MISEIPILFEIIGDFCQMLMLSGYLYVVLLYGFVYATCLRLNKHCPKKLYKPRKVQVDLNSFKQKHMLR